MKLKSSFDEWEKRKLANYAEESSLRIMDLSTQLEEAKQRIKDLELDLKTVLHAYRQLLLKDKSITPG